MHLFLRSESFLLFVCFKFFFYNLLLYNLPFPVRGFTGM